MADFGVQTPWQAFVQVRMRFYDAMLADPEVLRTHQWPHNVALLQTARQTGCKVGLATMSLCPQAQRVLDILDLREAFDFVATRDDVERGKPDPEIYRLVARELGVTAGECLVIEDSMSGFLGAENAGMTYVAITSGAGNDEPHKKMRPKGVHCDFTTLTSDLLKSYLLGNK